MDEADDDLALWILVLRQRLARGDLAGLAPLDIGNGARAPGELVIQVMLADLDRLDALLMEAPDGGALIERRRRLLDDFRRLRELIG